MGEGGHCARSTANACAAELATRKLLSLARSCRPAQGDGELLVDDGLAIALPQVAALSHFMRNSAWMLL
jgi:hypothetical protein